MAKDFRNASQLPDDFLQFDFAESAPDTAEDIEEKFGKVEAERLRYMMHGSGFMMGSNMVGTKAAIEDAAVQALKDANVDADLSGITAEAVDPGRISFCKDGTEFAVRYGMVRVNEEYMDHSADNGPGAYPMIPDEEYGDIGCSWIEYGDPTWGDFERIEKAMEQNQAADFTAGLEGIPGPSGLQQ